MQVGGKPGNEWAGEASAPCRVGASVGMGGQERPRLHPSVLREVVLCPPSHLSCITSFLPVSLPGRSTLSRCCNAPAFLFTTQKNTPLGTKLKYEVDTSGIYHINQEIFRMFPKVLLWAGRSGWGEGADPAVALRGNVPGVLPDSLTVLWTQLSWSWLTSCLRCRSPPSGFLWGFCLRTMTANCL